MAAAARTMKGASRAGENLRPNPALKPKTNSRPPLAGCSISAKPGLLLFSA